MKIIFLDIDGPVIPQPCYYVDPHCSVNRSVVSTIAIGYLNELCRLSNAKIVTNTMHNTWYRADGTGQDKSVKDDLIRHGIKPEYFHREWKSSFPVVKGRLTAIETWIEGEGLEDVNWVCFDDEKFTKDGRLIHIDFETGIQRVHFERACVMFGVDPQTSLWY